MTEMRRKNSRPSGSSGLAVDTDEVSGGTERQKDEILRSTFAIIALDSDVEQQRL